MIYCNTSWHENYMSMSNMNVQQSHNEKCENTNGKQKKWLSMRRLRKEKVDCLVSYSQPKNDDYQRWYFSHHGWTEYNTTQIHLPSF